MEDTTDLQALAFGYGFPYARLIIIKELRNKLQNLTPEEDTPENREVLSRIIGDIASVITSSKIGARPFPSTVGDIVLAVTRRGDPLLYGAPVDTPVNHVPVDESAEVVKHRVILEEVAQEIFTYVTFYLMKMMPTVDKAIYDVACAIFRCDRLVFATEKLTIPIIPCGELGEGSEEPSTIKQCLCLGFLRDTDEYPTLGAYCLTPTTL